jgi:hypothetical protein
MDVFCSIFCYSISKLTTDPDAFIRSEVEAGEKAEWPAFRTLGRLRKLVGRPLQLMTDRGTLIAKARSRALHTFLRNSDADVWITIDDDIEAHFSDLKLLLGAMRDPEAQIVIAPCAMRADLRLNIVTDGRSMRETAEGVRLLKVLAGGAALVGYKRAALEAMAAHYPELWYCNAPDDIGIGLFLETIRDNHWMGEDMQFCARARQAGVRLESLVDTAVWHAGVPATVSPEWLDAPNADTSTSRALLAPAATG